METHGIEDDDNTTTTATTTRCDITIISAIYSMNWVNIALKHLR